MDYEIIDANASLTDSAGFPRPSHAQDPGGETPTQRRVRIFNEINKTIPINEYGLPEYIYRADLISAGFEGLDDDEKEQTLQIASVTLNYGEGYPTIHDGRSFWSQLEFEPDVMYSAFQLYLDMVSTKGMRRLEELQDHPEIRLSKQALMEAFHYYYWGYRCKAFDFFRIAAYQKEREARIHATNNKHFLDAERLIGNLMTFFTQTDSEGNPRWLHDLTPFQAITALDKLQKAQRVALDLPAHGAAMPPEKQLLANAPIDTLMKALHQQAENARDAERPGNKSADLDMLLDNPEVAAMAQDLVLALSHKKGSSDG